MVEGPVSATLSDFRDMAFMFTMNDNSQILSSFSLFPFQFLSFSFFPFPVYVLDFGC